MRCYKRRPVLYLSAVSFRLLVLSPYTQMMARLKEALMSTIPRSEYPRPQFVRDDWLCLNGEWGFEIDQGDSGIQRGLPDRELSGRITVPFCPE